MILRFPASRAARVANLCEAERLLLLATRLSVLRRRRGLGPCPGIRSAFAQFGAGDAALSLEALLLALGRYAYRTIEIGCPACIDVTDDEARLLQIVALMQDSRDAAAQRVLETMLGAKAASFAIEFTRGLAGILAEADLLVPLRSTRIGGSRDRFGRA
jgi:hypothetical protein